MCAGSNSHLKRYLSTTATSAAVCFYGKKPQQKAQNQHPKKTERNKRATKAQQERHHVRKARKRTQKAINRNPKSSKP